VQVRRVAAVQTLNDDFGIENDDTHALRRYEQLFSQCRSGASSSWTKYTALTASKHRPFGRRDADNLS
jgi:hypothetical protein